jgi:hypothetical protein
MTQRRRFCPKGHDTFEVGRDSSYRCKRCKYEAKATTRKRATEARRREAEAIAAERAAVAAAEEKAAREQEARREREAQRRRDEEYRRAIAAGGDVAAEARWERLSDEALRRGPVRPLPMGAGQWPLRRMHSSHDGRLLLEAQPTARAGVRATAPAQGSRGGASEQSVK